VNASDHVVRLIVPVHTNQNRADGRWARAPAFRAALDRRLVIIASWLAKRAPTVWPGLRTVYANIWALAEAEIDPKEFRFLKRQGELQLSISVPGDEIATLPIEAQVRAVELALLAAIASGAERYKVDPKPFRERVE